MDIYYTVVLCGADEFYPSSFNQFDALINNIVGKLIIYLMLYHPVRWLFQYCAALK